METVRRYMEKCKNVARRFEQAEDPQVWANILNIQKAANDEAIRVAGFDLSVESIKESETLAEAFYDEAEYLEWMMAGVQRKTGIDISSVGFADLPGTVAGRYHTKTKNIELDSGLKGHRNKILHVAIHEALHACVGSKNPDVRLDIDFEEGIVEMLATTLTSELTGANDNVIAYHQEVSKAEGEIGHKRRAVRKAVLGGDVYSLLQYREEKQKLAGD